MTRVLRIVFMGTPDFAVASLKVLVAHDYNIVGVITAPDKPAGRGRKLSSSPVKVYAESIGLNVMQPSNLKSEAFLEELRSLKANLQIVVAFRMLPKSVWQMPQYGTFNLHASLLPDYRGAAPINWALINGEKRTGVTTFFIDENIDTGELILQEEIAIEDHDNAGSLHDKLMILGSELVLKTTALIGSGQVETHPQSEKTEIRTAHKLNKDNCKIDWNAPMEAIHNKIRGLDPYPAAWCYLKNKGQKVEVKIYDAVKVHDTHELQIGSINTTKMDILVAVENGFLKIRAIKLPGKRKMDSKSLLNGYKFDLNAKML